MKMLHGFSFLHLFLYMIEKMPNKETYSYYHYENKLGTLAYTKYIYIYIYIAYSLMFFRRR